MLKKKRKEETAIPRRLETPGERRVMDGGQKGEASVPRSFPVWLSLTSLFPGDLLPHEIISHHRLQKERLTQGLALTLVNLRDPYPSSPVGFLEPQGKNPGGTR
jgi:hypothetical protein